MTKSVYSASETGSCPKVLSAMKLGYDPLKQSDDDLRRLRYYTRLEAIAAQGLADDGFQVEPSTLCMKCQQEFGIERHGIHVEIDRPLFRLVGHLDRRIVLPNGSKLPVEIKSLGKNSWNRFNVNQFATFPEYAFQEACYLEAEQSPGIYWVMNRDTGDILKYIVNDNAQLLKGIPNYNLFTNITLPTTFSDVEDKLNLIEIDISSGTLSEVEMTPTCAYWCQFRYLCSKEEPEKESIEEFDPILVEASGMYKEGKKMEDRGKEMKETAQIALWGHARNNNREKYRVAGVSVSYRGMKRKVFLDDKTIRAESSAELIAKATRYSAEYPDYTIRILKEN